MSYRPGVAAYLQRILDSTRARVASSKRLVPIEALRERAGSQRPRDFIGAIRAPGISLVAEIKRRSPSAGDIRSDTSAGAMASAYERGGARAISVLTDTEFFGGTMEDLEDVSANCELPVLRKDFVIDPYQIEEAKAFGADALLLIVNAIGDQIFLSEMIAAARGAGLAALVEAHDQREIERALQANASLIGINQRDLVTFEVDKGLAARLRSIVPAEVPVIAESGIESRDDVLALEIAGLDGVLVGESLMRASDPAAKARELLGLPVE